MLAVLLQLFLNKEEIVHVRKNHWIYRMWKYGKRHDRRYHRLRSGAGIKSHRKRPYLCYRRKNKRSVWDPHHVRQPNSRQRGRHLIPCRQTLSLCGSDNGNQRCSFRRRRDRSDRRRTVHRKDRGLFRTSGETCALHAKHPCHGLRGNVRTHTE